MAIVRVSNRRRRPARAAPSKAPAPLPYDFLNVLAEMLASAVLHTLARPTNDGEADRSDPTSNGDFHE